MGILWAHSMPSSDVNTAMQLAQVNGGVIMGLAYPPIVRPVFPNLPCLFSTIHLEYPFGNFSILLLIHFFQDYPSKRLAFWFRMTKRSPVVRNADFLGFFLTFDS